MIHLSGAPGPTNERPAMIAVTHFEGPNDSDRVVRKFEYWEDADAYGETIADNWSAVPNAPQFETMAEWADYQKSYWSQTNRFAVATGTGLYPDSH